jgi:hypothetical protein
MAAGKTIPPSHHAVIAGTGRSGTSFLIKFLATCGLDIGEGLDEQWNDRASAGMERNLLAPDPPYLVKDPGFANYCSEVDLKAIALDALIVPIRDLASAATSRVLQERMAKVSRDGPGMMAPVEVAITPGGVLTSLDPVDQSRLLAVEFHRLIHWATLTSVPLYLLDFPRLVQDRDYLIDALWPWLSLHTDRERAEAAFDAVAEPEKVHFAEGGAMTRQAMSRDLDELVELDRQALRTIFAEQQHELYVLRTRLEQAEAYADELARQLAEAEGRIEHLSNHLSSKRYRYVDRAARLFGTSGS